MSGPQKTSLVQYQYDALDRLAGHSRSADMACKRFYCENRLVTETEGGAHISIVQHGDQLLAQQRPSESLGSSLLATDKMRSVFDALQTNRQRTIAYSPYGHRPRESGLSSLLGFNGQRPDSETGHYLLGNGYRAFNPVLMRFNSPDSLSPFGEGGLNAYCYCGGDPTNRIDPTGFISMPQFLSKILGSFSRSAPAKAAAKVTFATKDVKVIKFAKDAHLIFDTHKSAPRLTIRGHGTRRGYFRLSYFNRVTPVRLKSVIEAQGINFSDYKHIRLISCYGADVPSFISRRSKPFAQSFANAIDQGVVGFHGNVSRTAIESMEQGSSRSITFGVLKTSDGYPYSPEYFEPNKIRQAP